MLNSFLKAAFVTSAFLALSNCQDTDPVVPTAFGPVRGTSVPLENGDVIDSFLGIPFARAPVGELRFQPPQEPDPWEEVYNATDLGNACWQSVAMVTHPGYDSHSEDCLNLNVYSKQTIEQPLRPVLLFIHGGSFQFGANFNYIGYFLAAKDVVLVIINYRLGIMGFASTEDDVVPGNMGILDQVQALLWVQDNIQAFGGNPGQVTIFGESAGGASVGLLELYPEAQGLFHGAMFQSGNEMSPWAVSYPNTSPRNYLEQIAEQFDCPTQDSQEMVDCLRTVDAEELDNAEYDCTVGATSCLGGFAPVVDGTILTDLPHYMRERGEFIKVPELMGLNRNDAFLFIPFRFYDGATYEEMQEYWAETGQYYSTLWPDPTRADDWSAAMGWFYADWPYFNDTERNRDMLGEYLTDYYYGFPTDYHAKSSMSDMPVYFYVYDYLSENDLPGWPGVFHAYELSYVFGWPFLWQNPAALEHSRVGMEEYNWTDRDRDYSDFMMTLWTNFAKYGNPTPEPLGPGDETPFIWPAYSPANFSYGYLASSPYADIDYRQQKYAYYTEYLNYMIYDEDF